MLIKQLISYAEELKPLIWVKFAWKKFVRTTYTPGRANVTPAKNLRANVFEANVIEPYSSSWLLDFKFWKNLQNTEKSFLAFFELWGRGAAIRVECFKSARS
jgi:hypothetical protein